jgi:hypothetical protein
MVYFGKVRNGKIELDQATAIPEGTVVRIEPVATTPSATESDPVYHLADLAVDGGPSDLASEHDHYAYGTPKRGKDA